MQQSGHALAIFRILIGILLMKDVRSHFLLIRYHLNTIPGDFMEHYYGFEWLKPVPALISLSEILLPAAILCVMFGLFYRLAMPLTTLLVTYVFLLFPEHYLNHYYMLLLFCTLLSFMPANRAWALDAIIKKNSNHEVPAWCYWTLRIQTEIILIYAGLVKINPDWLRLQPLATWIRSDLHDVPIIGGFFYYDAVIAIGAYGIIILHIIGAPLLMWHKTRPWVFALYVCFHLTNSLIFDIGIFPFLTIGATLMFFDPDWPLKLFSRQEFSQVFDANKKQPSQTSSLQSQNITMSLLSAWLGLQILLPMPALFSSNLQTAWTGHHDQFSWRMMLNQRSVPIAVFVAHMPEKKQIEFVQLKALISERQCMKSIWEPNLTVQLAHYIEKTYAKKYETDNVKVHAYILNGINYRKPELWADPTKNLAAYRPIYGTPEWLEPIDNPFRTWRELIYAPKLELPTYREILQAMKIPEEQNTIFNENGITLDSPVSKIKCENNANNN